jgi:bifunctional non-homologous end joining protein LigD
VLIHHEAIRVLTRRGVDRSKQFKKIAEQAWLIKARSAIIDGEVVVRSENGLTGFSLLQSAMHSKWPSDHLVMYAFDLLYLNGMDLCGLPLIERKEQLARLIKGTDILLREHFETDGTVMFKNACAMGMEGVVFKRRDDRYHSDRTDSWRKVTCRIRETLLITGYAQKNGKFDGLYLGRMQGERLMYAGKVEHGFDRASEREIISRLRPVIQREQPYSVNPKNPKAVWAKPVLKAEIEYRGRTTSDKLRHSSFKGLREDV